MAEQKRILVIENEEDTLFLIGKALSNSGYLVETSMVGFGIVESKHCVPNLFILDKELPTIDGIALSKYLRLHEPTRQIPIIMISGYQVKQKAKQAGIDVFIKKPFRLEALVKVVKKYIQRGGAPPSG